MDSWRVNLRCLQIKSMLQGFQGTELHPLGAGGSHQNESPHPSDAGRLRGARKGEELPLAEPLLWTGAEGALWGGRGAWWRQGEKEQWMAARLLSHLPVSHPLSVVRLLLGMFHSSWHQRVISPSLKSWEDDLKD